MGEQLTIYLDSKKYDIVVIKKAQLCCIRDCKGYGTHGLCTLRMCESHYNQARD